MEVGLYVTARESRTLHPLLRRVSVSLPVGLQGPFRLHLSRDGALVLWRTGDLVQRVARFILAAFFQR